MIALDANILIRAVIGKRTAHLVKTYAGQVRLIAAEAVVSEARWHLSELSLNNRIGSRITADAFEQVLAVVERASSQMYAHLERRAMERLSGRDPDDWPTLALCMSLACPVWTEDYDFFGAGIPTWNTRNVEIFLREQVAETLN